MNKTQWFDALTTCPDKPGIYECKYAMCHTERLQWCGSGYKGGWRTFDGKWAVGFGMGGGDRWRGLKHRTELHPGYFQCV
jgi:hypothetical protein